MTKHTARAKPAGSDITMVEFSPKVHLLLKTLNSIVGDSVETFEPINLPRDAQPIHQAMSQFANAIRHVTIASMGNGEAQDALDNLMNALDDPKSLKISHAREFIR